MIARVVVWVSGSVAALLWVGAALCSFGDHGGVWPPVLFAFPLGIVALLVTVFCLLVYLDAID